ncbi:pyridoxamine 5'-phosphate oxidase family protein [Halorubrum vacuolatum]|uniref:Nitroimidazol reductase NimA, pyridoxamine 5'-phosphate oxidase superfamily n=1 Tax=Halorubrum vacuolatum TaxID=63740 RepID=A0A238VP66_HALVU|nr:pyridoxamine 5'-phosphate oxidase family protein [Halorubrum vacuolatum]SNR36135.1 hypothetical protein SAMN06264855_103226 [Halorubrum vacuolatum]
MADHYGLVGGEMDASAIDDALREIGLGVLSMSADGVPYGVPISFGYDGSDTLYFVFIDQSVDLRKESYAERSDLASFTAYDVNPDGSWRSVIVSGSLDRITIDEWDAAREALAGNAYRSNQFERYEIDENPNVWALDIDDRSGRAVGQR